MKIANITLTGLFNLGNRLQLYAMQQILGKYGEVENVEWLSPKSNCLAPLKNDIKIGIKLFLSQFFTKYKRFKSFYKFNKSNIKTSKIRLHNNRTIKKLNEKFDCFVTGSDQVWNPNLYFDDLYITMLGFTTQDKKVAISPSIASDDLSEPQKDVFKKYLKDFKYLSCREKQGAEILSQMFNKEVVDLLDPTLMLDKEDWLKVANKPKFHTDNEKFMVVYFLGELTESYKYVIRTISEQYNLKVVNLLDINNKYFSCGPSEFIYLISHCSLVLTDSFHASVFSYIFDKPFKIFNRLDSIKSMNSRLVNLVQKLQLDPSVYFEFGQGVNIDFDCKYNKDVLKRERQIFNDYVEKVLGKSNDTN